MRKPTGPGKVKDNLSVPPKSRKMTTALLYNFDIDDATVKPEHEKWLQENAVKPLLAVPGCASR